jgi:predicted aminopeptidase
MVRDSPPRPTRALAVAAASIALGGCYYLHLAAGQAEMSRQRRPIPEVIADPGTDGGVRDRLEVAVRARDFAMTELGLPDNGSYRTFADLGRRYATWNLFAAPELSVEPKRWCFPIAGCVPYRGYFDEDYATRTAGRLRERGYDTWVGPSIAYSTLGHLRDPVLNTMLGYGDTELAAFLFHELAHQVVYAPGDSDFNEAFAMLVEVEGLRRWLAREGPPEALERFLAARERERRAAVLLVETRRRLAAVYAEVTDPVAAQERKAAEFARLQEALAADGHPVSGEYNNARLVAAATYERCVPALRTELERLGGDLPAFYDAMKQLEDDDAARAKLCPRA